MATYHAPLNDMQFVLFDVLNAQQLASLPGYEDASPELIATVLDEARKVAENALFPVNASGDLEGVSYDPETHSVTTPKGYKEAYKVYAEGGWSGLSASPDFGGQGLPHLLSTVVKEMSCSANLSLSMYPGLSHGAIDALTEHATRELQDAYLPKLISGEWTGTMCLTEPQCGTDLGLITTKAEPQADGSYAVTGTKIWITGGEHDLVDNIVHLVLAKLPDAPEGTKGISLFLVPKVLEDGQRNPAFCGGLEHKMGIHGSATCVMNFEAAKGWLIGEPNQGLKSMFTMMNAARIMVGIQGLGLAETAYQTSLGFAKERLQSRSIAGAKNPDAKADPIIVHADVRRMLAYQKVFLEGARCMAYWASLNLDISERHGDDAEREKADDIVQIMTPIVKAYLTDEGYLSTDAAIQSMGGSGYTQDWGVEQLLRDARIARIYEGTNGIQALDLVGRKLALKGGGMVRTFMAELTRMVGDIENPKYAEQAKATLKLLQETLGWLAQEASKDPEQAAAGATPLLKLFALTTLSVLWGVMDAKAKAAANEGTYADTFCAGKQKAAAHFYRYFLPEATLLAEDVKAGKSTLMAFAENEF